ncbi:MAG: hypothetical protein JNG88_11745 [Phycisphaerales bacterium]|nr:hypothetical protein [Phycisphaerales bacterium]
MCDVLPGLALASGNGLTLLVRASIVRVPEGDWRDTVEVTAHPRTASSPNPGALDAALVNSRGETVPQKRDGTHATGV